MRYLRALPLLWMVGLSLAITAAHAADEDAFLGQILPQSEQTIGRGHSALWTFPHIATQYQPAHTPPQMQRALQAQHEGRYLDALILLDEVERIGDGKNRSVKITDDVNLLRASFLLQDKQTLQAVEILSPMIADHSLHAADALALTAMTHLQQGQTQEALAVAQRARSLGDGLLPHLAFSYALQAVGRLAEARTVMHGFNTPPTHAQLSNTQLPNATSLAREAELALTLNDIPEARALISQAAAHPSLASQPYAQPYVTSVSGLVALISGQPQAARTAFETALQRDAKDARALLGMGLAAIQLGDLQAGLKHLQAANEADPSNALTLTYLGRVQQQQGQTAAAQASWQAAMQADPKDPNPWLYQAQAQLQANQPQAARESLRQAQARTAYRAVYRGQNLLQEDAQLLQINLAEALRMQGLDELAFHTLSDGVGEKNAANLRGQADVLQNIRFAQSARRSVALQSLFNDSPGNIPLGLDVFGDGAGQTGASTPQHGVVSGLNAQHASYNDYGALFAKPNLVEVDGMVGNQGTQGGQARMGVGSDKVGLSFAYRQFETEGISRFNGLNNDIWQGVLQWRPLASTQAFVTYHEFDSLHGETIFPFEPFGVNALIKDHSQVARLGLRHTFSSGHELRGLFSQQDTTNNVRYEYFDTPPTISSGSGNSEADSKELQYRLRGTSYALQTGVQVYRGTVIHRDALGNTTSDDTFEARQIYLAAQLQAHANFELHGNLSLGENNRLDSLNAGANTMLLQRWLPKLGGVYSARDSTTHVRFATWRTLGVPTVGGADLAPASFAGIVLTRPSDNGKLIEAWALGADRQLGTDWQLTLDGRKTKTQDPWMNGTQQEYFSQQFTEGKFTVHWQAPAQPWGVNMSHELEQFRNDDTIFAQNNSVHQQTLRTQKLSLRWQAHEQISTHLSWSHNRVTGLHQSTDLNTFESLLLPYQDKFNQVDAHLNWQPNTTHGSILLGVRNAGDNSSAYTESDSLSPRFSKKRLIYTKVKLSW